MSEHSLGLDRETFSDVRWVTKLDVVRRQLVEAIHMFFNQRDPVAIYTVVGCAHQILVDLGARQNVKSVIKGYPGISKESIATLNGAINFFKHADRDPDAKVNITPLYQMSCDYVFDAILMLFSLASEIPEEAKIYWMWMVSKFPSEFPDDGELGKMKAHKLADWDFPTIANFLKFAKIMEGVPVPGDQAAKIGDDQE